MADPFSIVAGTAGLADICVRVTRFIRQANAGRRNVDHELESLSEEIGSLHSVNDLVRRSFTEGYASKDEDNHDQILEDHWYATEDILCSCQRIVEQIEALLREVVNTGSGKHVKLDQLRKWLKQQSKEEEFAALRQRLKAHQIALQLGLSAINMTYSLSSQQTSHHSYSELSRSIQAIGSDLQSKLNALEKTVSLSSEEKLKSAVTSAQNMASLAHINKHFFAPQTVSSCFTGREKELEILKEHLIPSLYTDTVGLQKRFVIFGLAGSGKTQFCCKFASDNKNRFWGVFWVNASSKAHAEQSFSTISTIGKVAPNQAAVKSWLASLGSDQPWLLIVDNADEKDFPVEECIPSSNSGTVLITTRNPMLKTHGTVGPRYFEFQGLGETKSIELLLNTADEMEPWSPSSVSLARTIATVMGCLPLALIHAGKTILARLCTLETYLEFFEKSWNRVRGLKDPTGAASISDSNVTIYSSYELILNSISTQKHQASADALDLLRIFCFLDRQHIRMDIFSRAALNPTIELLEEVRKDKERATYIGSKPKSTLAQSFKEVIVRVVSHLLQLGYKPVLPRFIYDIADSGMFDDLRLRRALNELSRMSLISPSSGPEDCYSMHATVHLWARERPEMTLAEQAIWCQMASNILSRAILLPPLGDTEDEETFRRDLLPHVRHVQQVELKIQAAFARNQQLRKHPWPRLTPPITIDRLVQLVKFSLIYTQGHQLEEAERLQIFVAKFATQYLGLEHLKTIGIMRLLSWTYWQLARIDKAVELQKLALDACIKVLGRENPETLQIMDSYGSCLWLQGRIPEARKIHASAVEGLRKTLGGEHIQTLKAMGGWGRAVGKDFDFAEAIEIQSTAFDGLKGQLGPAHSATLEAMDNLAMAYFDRAAYRRGEPGDVTYALELESKVYEMRKERFGREHYHTLWSGLNLARIKAIGGDMTEALAVFLPGHAVVRRDLGENHFIYLFGELHHGRILMCGGKYEQALEILSKVVDAHQDDKHRHPDRLMAMFSMIKCRNVLGKDQQQTTALLEELTESTKALFGPDHKAVQYLIDGSALSADANDVVIEAMSQEAKVAKAS